jgi:hypothetical protein
MAAWAGNVFGFHEDHAMAIKDKDCWVNLCPDSALVMTTYDSPSHLPSRLVPILQPQLVALDDSSRS